MPPPTTMMMKMMTHICLHRECYSPVLVHDMTRWINVRKFIWLRQVRPHPCLYRHLILRKVFAFGFSSNIILCHLCLSVCLTVCLTLSLCISGSDCLSVCLSVCLSDSLCVLSVVLSVCLSVCLSLTQHYRETNRYIVCVQQTTVATHAYSSL